MPTSGQFAIRTTTRSPAGTPSFTSLCRPAGPVEQLARPVRPALENETLVVAEPVERRLGQRGKVVVNLRRCHARPPRSARLPDGNARKRALRGRYASRSGDRVG